MRSAIRLKPALLILLCTSSCSQHDTPGGAPAAPKQAGRLIRVATYNVSLYRRRAGDLAAHLESGDEKARQIAEVIQSVRPDVLLINEFDYDETQRAIELFRTEYLGHGQSGQPPVEYPFLFTAPANTGEPSGLDLDNDGRTDTPNDAIGYGRFPGQYGMVVLSRFPIDTGGARTFRQFLWRDMPDAKLPTRPQDGSPWYADDELAVLRLASKSFWDVPIRVPGVENGSEAIVHFLVAHPTPPVFDGPEDRNGLRNHDEIRMIADYITPRRGSYLVDDAGRNGGLKAGACFVIAGDLNADPVDGAGVDGAIRQLLEHQRVNPVHAPKSDGGAITAAAHPTKKQDQRGDPACDTADFGPDGSGNLRVDYVLPSRSLGVDASGIFWPTGDAPGSEAVRASDHRLVWVDIKVNTLKTCQIRQVESK